MGLRFWFVQGLITVYRCVYGLTLKDGQIGAIVPEGALRKLLTESML